MKALTIYQPWATLIMLGAKPYEFRSWSPRERGGAYAALIGQRIVIHASSRKMPHGEVQALLGHLRSSHPDEVAMQCLHPDKAIPLLERVIRDVRRDPLDLGAGLGTAILGEPRKGYDIAEEFGLPHVNDSDRDEDANFGWPMLDIEVWDEPVPMRGFQGFWNWPSPESIGL